MRDLPAASPAATDALRLRMRSRARCMGAFHHAALRQANPLEADWQLSLPRSNEIYARPGLIRLAATAPRGPPKRGLWRRHLACTAMGLQCDHPQLVSMHASRQQSCHKPTLLALDSLTRQSQFSKKLFFCIVAHL